jgi:hypothetical protein
MTRQPKSINYSIVVLCLTLSFYLPCLVPAEEKNTPQKDSPQSQKSGTQDKPNPYADADISIKIIPSVNKTYGYDILSFKWLFVHQPNISGLPGNEGFTTEERAKTVAEYVVKKIRNNEMPPTVSIEDLNRMGVLK